MFRHRPYPEAVSEYSCRQLAASLNVSLIAASLLCQRGQYTAEQAGLYLDPKLSRLPSPFLFQDMDKAVNLILQAMEQNWPVVVYGDYDVDGLCATALMVEFLSQLHIDVQWHIPNRQTEGYGLKSSTVQGLHQKTEGAALLITVDNGISSLKEVDEAKRAGFHVLITDHHEPLQELPDADALINPKQQGCCFPFNELSGAGVAFYLLIALRSKLIEMGYWTKDKVPNLKEYLDLVALGTVADVMPLSGVNRVLVRAGLEVLTERKRPGILALCEKTGLREGNITAEDISFRLAPRINAAGRVGSPEDALHLLLSRGMETSFHFAEKLEQNNAIRRKQENEILGGATGQCIAQVQQNNPALVAYEKEWNSGVIGIVSSRLCERFSLPVILFADDPIKKGFLRGSGRTVGDIDIFSAVSQCSQYLDKFGGHPRAIGLTIREENLKDFSSTFRSAVAGQVSKGAIIESREILFDYHIDDETIINNEFLSFLRRFEPFGEDNPEPVFLIRNKKLLNVRLIKDEHLKFALRLNNNLYRGIGFYMKDMFEAVEKHIDLAFTFKHTVFRGEERVELMAVAINKSY